MKLFCGVCPSTFSDKSCFKETRRSLWCAQILLVDCFRIMYCYILLKAFVSIIDIIITYIYLLRRIISSISNNNSVTSETIMAIYILFIIRFCLISSAKYLLMFFSIKLDNVAFQIWFSRYFTANFSCRHIFLLASNIFGSKCESALPLVNLFTWMFRGSFLFF